MSLPMQVVMANFFAAFMTFAVITFPSPGGMVDVLTSPFVPQVENTRILSGGIVVRPMPSRYDRENLSLGWDTETFERVTEGLNQCAYSLSRVIPGETTERCKALLNEAVYERQDWTPNDAHTLDPLTEDALLVAAYLCQIEFASGYVSSAKFAPCIPDALSIAMK